jgi:cation transport ATPase
MNKHLTNSCGCSNGNSQPAVCAEALTCTGHATMWMAVFAEMGASLLVVFNGLRLLKLKTA